MRAVVWIGAPGSDDAALVGGKAAALGRAAADVRPLATVPPGFTIPGALDPGALAGALSTLGDRAPVAVRSSAREESGAGASFAGQHETVLGVRGLEGAAAAVRRCRTSARSPRATAYRSPTILRRCPCSCSAWSRPTSRWSPPPRSGWS